MEWDLRTLCAIVVWFSLHVILGNMTKGIFVWYSFKRPIFVTTIHMIVSTILCWAAIRPVWRMRKPDAHEPCRGQFVSEVLPLAGFFCISVVSGNFALKYVFVSYNQFLAPCAPLATVLVATVSSRQRFNRWAWIGCGIIALGTVAVSTHEAHFHVLGLVFSLAATATRAIKSVVQERLLSKRAEGMGQMDAVILLAYMAPPSVGMLGMAAVVMEPGSLDEIRNNPQPLQLVGWLVFSGIIACAINLANFVLTFFTDAVTVQVLGVAKMVVTSIVSVYIFHNPVSNEQILGCAFATMGIYVFKAYGERIPSTSLRTKSLERIQIDTMADRSDSKLAQDNAHQRLGRGNDGKLRGNDGAEST